MLLSIFTPTHRDGTYLLEAWETIKEQTFLEWQWVIVVNNGGVVPDEISRDARVKVVTYLYSSSAGKGFSIGALKRFACQHCTGEVFVELDDDDLLPPDALEKIHSAFLDDQIQYVYSNTAEFVDKTWKPNTFSAWWGWKNRPYEYKGHQLLQNVAWTMTPQSLRHIYWSPNHVRCWRASAYWKVGGHNPDLFLIDDHDMNIRFYLAYGDRGCKHVDDALYLYRKHAGSTCYEYSADIRAQDALWYDRYIVAMAERWVKDKNLMRVDLGGAFNSPEGYMSVDLREGADVQSDLNERWPFRDGVVGIVRASHILEHLRDPIHTMNELHRVLAPGGFAFIEVPSTDGRGAWQDPTHISFWNQNSFFYYTRQEQAQYIQPQSKARFQESKLATYYPNKFFRDNRIPCVIAHLICLKPEYEEIRAGEVLI